MRIRSGFGGWTPGLPVVVALAAALIAATACNDTTSVSPTSPGTVGANVGVLSSQVLSAMNRAIQDEYLAEATYSRVVADFGEVQPFWNIVFAEERHSAAIARLFQSFGLVPPTSTWSPSDVAAFDNLASACAAGVQAETGNVAMYDEFMTYADLPVNVRTVFENLRAVSLNNHLPAFESCCACLR